MIYIYLKFTLVYKCHNEIRNLSIALAMCETLAPNFAQHKNNNKTHLTRPQITHTHTYSEWAKAASILY